MQRLCRTHRTCWVQSVWVAHRAGLARAVLRHGHTRDAALCRDHRGQEGIAALLHLWPRLERRARRKVRERGGSGKSRLVDALVSPSVACGAVEGQASSEGRVCAPYHGAAGTGVDAAVCALRPCLAVVRAGVFGRLSVSCNYCMLVRCLECRRACFERHARDWGTARRRCNSVDPQLAVCACRRAVSMLLLQFCAVPAGLLLGQTSLQRSRSSSDSRFLYVPGSLGRPRRPPLFGT